MKKLWRDRVEPLADDLEWLALGGLAATAFILGYIGFGDQPGQALSPLDRVYRSLQLFFLEYGSTAEPMSGELDVARLLAPAVTAFAAAKALAALFREQVQSLRARFRPSRNVVVCGLGRCGVPVARAFKERGAKVVVIERDRDNDAIRECRREGIIVLHGDASDRHVLARAGVEHARHVVAACGDDGVNAEVAIRARELVRERSGRPLRGSIQVLDFELRDLLEESELGGGAEDDRFRPDFFNPAERGAPALLDEHPPFDGEGKAPSRPAHVLVVGLGEMGSNVVVHTALRWRTTGAHGRLPVTAVDLEATRRVDLLCRRYPQLASVCDLHAVAEDVRSPEVQSGEFLARRPHPTVAYICLDDDTKGLGAALALRRLQTLRGAPIVVRMTEQTGLASLLAAGDGKYENIHAFALLDWICKPDVLLNGVYEVLARSIHETWLAAQPAGRDAKPSAVPWDRLAEGYKESSRRQAEHIRVKLEAVGCKIVRLRDWDAEPLVFDDDEIELMAQMEHRRWRKEHEDEGWTLGERDDDRKTHPDLVEWEKLPRDSQDYDRGTVRNLPAFLARLGYAVVRTSEDAPR